MVLLSQKVLGKNRVILANDCAKLNCILGGVTRLSILSFLFLCKFGKAILDSPQYPDTENRGPNQNFPPKEWRRKVHRENDIEPSPEQGH